MSIALNLYIIIANKIYLYKWQTQIIYASACIKFIYTIILRNFRKIKTMKTSHDYCFTNVYTDNT